MPTFCAESASALLSRYREIRAATEALCTPLETEDYIAQSMPDASPAKWHLAHTNWFFEEFVLQNSIPQYRFYDPALRYLFNSYYQSVGPMHERSQRGLITRPTVRDVYAYRAYVDEQMRSVLEDDALAAGTHEIITLGLHHEEQHQELLLTDLKHLFFCNPLHPVYASCAPRAGIHLHPQPCAEPLTFRPFQGTLTDVGHAGGGFSFDNERPRHQVYLEPFELASRPVTNAEFLQFILEDGYQRPELWLCEGWECVQRLGWQRPLYWDEALEQEFTLMGPQALDPQAPVSHLSFYEAESFARFFGARLPTEFEWEHAVDERTLPGQVWEWTQSAYAPYPGFKPASGALGEYNGKFMVNQLVLRGGSCVTPPGHIRSTYRNFFPAAARWQFAGLRLARNV